MIIGVVFLVFINFILQIPRGVKKFHILPDNLPEKEQLTYDYCNLL